MPLYSCEIVIIQQNINDYKKHLKTETCQYFKRKNFIKGKRAKRAWWHKKLKTKKTQLRVMNLLVLL